MYDQQLNESKKKRTPLPHQPIYLLKKERSCYLQITMCVCVCRSTPGTAANNIIIYSVHVCIYKPSKEPMESITHAFKTTPKVRN